VRRTLLPITLLCAIAAGGCVGAEPRESIGGQCDLTSDCEAPLVCRLERCRKECVTSRDCGLGLRCIIAPPDGLGVCQLPEETTCMLDSDCIQPLVCIDGCTNECDPSAGARDCPAGAICDAETMTCKEPVADLCVYPSDCPFPLTCGTTQQCEIECEDRIDCNRFDPLRHCVPHRFCEEDLQLGPGAGCRCRRLCDTDVECPAGMICEPCPDGADCSGPVPDAVDPDDETAFVDYAGFCEREELVD